MRTQAPTQNTKFLINLYREKPDGNMYTKMLTMDISG